MRTVETSAKRSTLAAAEIALLDAEQFGAVRRHEIATASIQIPLIAGFGVEADDVDEIPFPPDDPGVAGGDDLRRGVQAFRSGDERPREVGLDLASGNRRNSFGVQRRRAHCRRQAGGRTLERKAPLAIQPVQNDYVAGIDQVRVPDLLAVHLPDIGPAPGILEELPGDAPQGVPLLHRIAAGNLILELDVSRARSQRTHWGERHGCGDDEIRYAKLLTHKASSIWGGAC